MAGFSYARSLHVSCEHRAIDTLPTSTTANRSGLHRIIKEKQSLWPQAVETPIVTVCVKFGVFRRKLEPRNNLPDSAFSTQDALIR